MKKTLSWKSLPFYLFLVAFFFSISGCAAATPAATATPTLTATSAPTGTPTATLTLTPSPTRTPPALPKAFEASALNPLDAPHTYIEDTCQALHDQWAATKSTPGTVVMPIMFHSITTKAVTSSDQISEFAFRQLMNKLHDNGFEAITTTQLADFLETNAKIPERSVVLIVDDRRTEIYFNTWFRKYWQEWGWKVVNAWISTDLSTTDLWQQQVNLSNEGWVDYEAHGYQHMPSIGPDSPEEYILQELQKPIEAFQEHFNKMPIAFIWPGGGFTARAVELARQNGYRLGFTTNPRGPVMFNWVPLADIEDARRPTWIPEGLAKDPLLLLPRYWDTDAITHVDTVIRIGEDARAYAGQNKSTELDYYDIVCAPKYGLIP